MSFIENSKKVYLTMKKHDKILPTYQNLFVTCPCFTDNNIYLLFNHMFKSQNVCEVVLVNCNNNHCQPPTPNLWGSKTQSTYFL